MRRDTVVSAAAALGMLCGLGCSSHPPSESQATQKPPTQSASSDTYRYVFGVDAASGMVKHGAAHRVVDLTAGKAEAIDTANRPSSLHPELAGAEHHSFDATLVSGETDWNVFPSDWWPQHQNGIAKRWPGATDDYSNPSDGENLSPVEKYDLLFHPGRPQTVHEVSHWDYEDTKKPESARSPKHSHPRVIVIGPATKWELEHHGVYQAFSHPESGWWGHCNGWSSYATTEPLGAPKRDIWVRHRNGWQADPFAPPPKEPDLVECSADEEDCVLFRAGDIEALMTELYFSDQATMAGRRCEQAAGQMELDAFGRPTDPACRDLNPGSFHIAVTGLYGRGAKHLGSGAEGRPPFIIDFAADWQVWNFPVLKFEIAEAQELTHSEAAGLVSASSYVFNEEAERFTRVRLFFWMVSDAVAPEQMLLPAADRVVEPHKVEVNYVLELDAAGTILGGEWINQPMTVGGPNNQELHPDFFWIGTSHAGYDETGNDTGGDNDNPYLNYYYARALLQCANDASSCSP